MLGIVDPGQLNEDSFGSLALDCRFLGPRLVDPTTNDFDRLIDGLPTPLAL